VRTSQANRRTSRSVNVSTALATQLVIYGPSANP
jgi:hypothetical protein